MSTKRLKNNHDQLDESKLCLDEFHFHRLLITTRRKRKIVSTWNSFRFYQTKFDISLDCQMSVDDKILSSDISNSCSLTPTTTSYPYHTSKCGSILYSTPTNSPTEIFKYLSHNNFDAFRRSLDVYYNEISRMRNERGQVMNFKFNDRNNH